MYKHITNVSKSVILALPDANKGRQAYLATLRSSSELTRSPKTDIFVKKVVDSTQTPHLQIRPHKTDTITPLNLNSVDCEFFGVASEENIQEKLFNQIALSVIKNKEQNIADFKNISLDTPFPFERIEKGLKALFSKGSARITMRSKSFGEKEASHTIGIVFDKNNNTMYILDSLSTDMNYEKIKSGIMERKNKYLALLLRKHNCELIDYVFSSKPQQKMNEYTCNNWTHANIEAVQDAIKEGKVLNQEELNAILPDDINEILRSQRRYLIQEHPQQYEYILNALG